MHRLYEHGDIAVFWDSDKCFHAKKCVHGCPEAFDPVRKPWIDLTKASTPKIWQAINECPSGALTCVYTHGIRIVHDEKANKSIAYDDERQIGECDYRIAPEGWIIYHTEVLPEYGGKGIAKRLVYKVVEAAEKNGNPVVPTCTYAQKVL